MSSGQKSEFKSSTLVQVFLCTDQSAHVPHPLQCKMEKMKKISLRFKVKGSENETSNSWLFPTITGTECGAENVVIQKFSV